MVDLNEYKKDYKIFVDKAKECATSAIKFDKLEEYEKALDFYVKAANYLTILIKHDKNPYSVGIYKDRAKEYILRAKEIKEK